MNLLSSERGSFSKKAFSSSFPMDFLGIGYHFDGEYKANSVVDTVVPSVHDVFVVFVILWRFGPENLSDCLVVEGGRVEKSEEGVVEVVPNAAWSSLREQHVRKSDDSNHFKVFALPKLGNLGHGIYLKAFNLASS